MSKPKRDGDDVRQIATYVKRETKDGIARLAAREKKPRRQVVNEALEAHLRSKADGEDTEE